jgi:hypothetical protein
VSASGCEDSDGGERRSVLDVVGLLVATLKSSEGRMKGAMVN